VLVACDADCLEPQSLGAGPPTDRDHNHIRREALPLDALELQGQVILSCLYSRHLGGEFELDPRSREHALQSRAELAVHARDDMVEHLDDGHCGAEPLPHRAELEPDITAADDDEPARDAAERQGAGRRDNPLLVDFDARQRSAFRAGRDDDRGRLDILPSTVRAGDDNPPRPRNLPPALEPIDLVLAEQKLDASGQGRHDLVFAAHHRREVECRLADPDPVLGELASGFGEFMGGLQQRLRRDAADVEAGPAEADAALDASRCEPELGGSDRRDVTPRTGPYDDDVVTIAHGAIGGLKRAARFNITITPMAPLRRSDGIAAPGSIIPANDGSQKRSDGRQRAGPLHLRRSDGWHGRSRRPAAGAKQTQPFRRGHPNLRLVAEWVK